MVIGVALIVCGCADEGPPANACPGTPPALADCETGRNYADCGGTGGPVFACSPGGDCRWFVAGCTPAEYLRSRCPADDICCVNDYPFDVSSVDELVALNTYWTLYGNGTNPWNGTDHMVVPVTVDPNLAVSATDLTCSWTSDGAPCLDNTVSATSPDVFVAFGSHSTLTLELSHMSPPLARVCTFLSTDAADFTCPSWTGVDCATSGTVVVSAVESTSGVAGTLDLTFASGATLSGDFVVP